MTKTQEINKDFAVRIAARLPGDDNMTVRHEGRKLVIAYPIYGSGNALEILEKIEADNEILRSAGSDLRIRQAQTPEVISVVAPAYRRLKSGDQNTDRTANEVTSIMDRRYARTATGILYHPDTKLAYFISNPKFDKGSFVDTKDLIARVESEKEEFETVPFSEIKEGKRTLEDLRNDEYVKVWAGGQESVEKLIGIGQRTPAKGAYVWVPNVSALKVSEGRVADLYVGYAGRLDVGGGVGGGGGGSAFGVLESGEAGAPKK